MHGKVFEKRGELQARKRTTFGSPKRRGTAPHGGVPSPSLDHDQGKLNVSRVGGAHLVKQNASNVMKTFRAKRRIESGG